MRYEYLVASPTTLLSLAKDLKQQNHTYDLIEIEFNNFNSYWRGKKGIALQVSREAYLSLHTQK